MNKKKIFYIHPGRMPRQNASSIQVNHQCSAFSKIINLVLICPMVSSKKKYQNYYGINSNFEIIPLKFRDYTFGGYIWALEASLLAKEKKPDLVYTRDIAVSFFCTLLNIPNIIEIHQDLSTFSFILKIFFRWSTKKDHCNIVAISKNLGKYLSNEMGVHRKKIIIAHDAAPEISKPGIKKKFNKPVKVGYVGSLHKGKGIEIILPLAKKFQMCQFHIVGGTKEQINKAKITASKNIIFHGHMIQKKAFQLLKKFDIVLAPYSNIVRGGTPGNLAKWMSPLKIFEYMAFQKPIICSKLTPLLEIGKNDETMIFCSPNNIDDWKMKLKNLLLNPKKAFKLGINARKLYEKKFTYKIRADKIINKFN